MVPVTVYKKVRDSDKEAATLHLLVENIRRGKSPRRDFGVTYPAVQMQGAAT